MRFGHKTNSDMYYPHGEDAISGGNKRSGARSGGMLSGMKPINTKFGSMKSDTSKSKTPTRKLMEELTHCKAHIEEDTKILINATEMLTHKGI